MRILLIEDDDVLADGIRAGLAMAAFTVDVAVSLEDGRAALAAERFDALILDLMLPDGSGFELLDSLRAETNCTPILLLTALDEHADRVRGLDAGADDYLGKPFDLDELAARLRAIARRANGRAAAQLTWRGVVLDPARLAATVEGVAVQMSRREFAILSALMERPGIIRSKGELEARLYGWQEGVESNTVEVHVHHLRSKIGRDAIETVRGLGYRLRPGP